GVLELYIRDVSFLSSSDVLCLLFCFFFQAEDGIRDSSVTGVQTCALPISALGSRPSLSQISSYSASVSPSSRCRLIAAAGGPSRSEERRVGKECRSRRAP